MIAGAADRNTALFAWYRANKRDLPWRRTSDPYPILVSEVMLQQTQVDRVIPKYEEFLERWPTVEALAGARTDALLAAWSGLGYNARALRLRDAARHIAESGWPTTLEGLQDLPGVGPYTASALASFAFGETVPAIDTNLRRVISRWAGEPLDGAALRDAAWEAVGDPSADWNQALMDLGSTLCRPRDPRCDACPVSEWCADPEVYEAPRPQARFEGSHRQLRGAILRAHVDGEDLRDAGRALGRSAESIERAIEELAAEGFLAE